MSPTEQPAHVRRRTVTRGIAWTAPAIAVGAAAPHMAASVRERTITTGDGAPFTVERCGTVPAGRVTFKALDDGQPAAPGGPVTIALPPGLEFVTGGSTTTVAIGAGGIVSVPAFRAYGAAGSYAIRATYGESTATYGGIVTPPPGQVTEFRGTFTGSGTPSTQILQVPRLTAGTAGAISGDNNNHRNVAIVNEGKVRFWGDNSTGTNATPGTLRYGGADLTGMTTVSTFTVDGSSSATGGIATGTGSDTVYQWYSSGSADPTTRKVSGISGTVLDVQAHAGRCYVLTTSGIYSWSTVTTGSGTITATGPIAGTAGASTMSTYAPSSTSRGGAVIVGGQLKVWSGDGAATNVTGTGTNQIADVVATTAGLVALTTNGDMYTQGPGFDNSGTPGRTAWTRRATGVSQISAWGVGNYFGGTYISQGVVHQMFAFTSNAYSDKVVGGLAGKSLVQSFAADGTYMALASDGSVYYWYKNNDTLGSANPVASQLSGVTNAVDLNVWAYHASTNFYGGGYVITAGSCS